MRYSRNSGIVCISALSLAVILGPWHSGTQVARAQVCGDFNGSGAVTSADIIATFNYCVKSGDAPLDYADGDCDDYDTITVRDAASLIKFVFLGGATPTCPPTQGIYVPSLKSSDTLTLPADTLPASDSVLSTAIMFNASSIVFGMVLPLQVRVGGAIPEIDTVIFDSRVTASLRSYGVDTAAGTITIGVMSFSPGDGVEAGDDTLATLHLRIAPDTGDRAITLDTLLLAPYTYTMFLDTGLTGTIPEVISVGGSGPEGVCGDFNGSASVSLSDITAGLAYCFLADATPPASYADADCDDYDSITVRDVALLSRWLFGPFPADPPSCPPSNAPYVPSLQSADTLRLPVDTLPASDSLIALTLTYKNAATIHAMSLPLSVTIGGEIPTIDSVVLGSAGSAFDLPATSIDSSAGTLKLGLVGSFSGGLDPGDDTLATVFLSMSPDTTDRTVGFDTLLLPPFNYPLFLTPDLVGEVPVITGLTPVTEKIPHPMEIILFSPVDMVVTDPDGDSIGIGFNTIGNGAVYDTASDVNSDLDLDDVVFIPNPLAGDYQVRIFREPDAPDSAKFTLGIRINGNQLLIPEDYEEQSVAALGTTIPETVEYTATTTLAGDVNADGQFTSSDIIFLVNYAFKSGPPPDILSHGDVNCDGSITSADIIYMVNFVFKSGDPPCSQSG